MQIEKFALKFAPTKRVNVKRNNRHQIRQLRPKRKKGQMVKIIVVVSFALALCSCRGVRVLERTTTETVTYRDTVVTIKSDTALLNAYLECDSLGNVLLKRVVDAEGAYTSLDVKLEKGVLEIRSVATPGTIGVRYPEKLIVTRDYVKVPHDPPWWMRLLSWIGAISVIGFVIRLSWKKRAGP